MRTVLMLLSLGAAVAETPRAVIVRPVESDEILVNPGIGFTTFQRFNGDRLNEAVKWTEGHPIGSRLFTGSLAVPGQPLSTIAYLRIYWRYLEPQRGAYNWSLLDTALKTARERGQTLMLRIAPYGRQPGDDVPDWYRGLSGEDPQKKLPVAKWRVDPENPAYAKYFGGFIQAVAARYDGHPDLELVDISIIGAWGEGAGDALLSAHTKMLLMESYLNHFRRTLLVVNPNNARDYPGLAGRNLGWRVDCLGHMTSNDLGRSFSHMLDHYPQAIVQTGIQDFWMTGPVSLEACYVMQGWKDRGWDIDYIIEQSLKLHISSFNNKSSAVPPEWQDKVDRWLKRMGYRFVLRRFAYPEAVSPQGKLVFTSWWENKGVAPIYRRYPLALRLAGPGRTLVLRTEADIRKWLPGDSIYEDGVFLPAGLPPGEYTLSLAVLDPQSGEPKVKLAIQGRQADGWYPLGKIKVVEGAGTWPGEKFLPM